MKSHILLLCGYLILWSCPCTDWQTRRPGTQLLRHCPAFTALSNWIDPDVGSCWLGRRDVFRISSCNFAHRRRRCKNV